VPLAIDGNSPWHVELPRSLAPPAKLVKKLPLLGKHLNAMAGPVAPLATWLEHAAGTLELTVFPTSARTAPVLTLHGVRDGRLIGLVYTTGRACAH
jgi:hypothetical protein